MFEPWKEANILVNMIRDGVMDAHIVRIGQECERRLRVLSDAKTGELYGATGLNAAGRDKVERAVVGAQQKVVFVAGDLARVGASTNWRFADLVVKVLRVNPTSCWVRAVAAGRPGNLSGYQWFRGFKVPAADLRPILSCTAGTKAIAAQIPLPGPKLVIGRAATPAG